MKRRNAEPPENTESGEIKKEKPRDGQKYSVFMYITVMFSVVVCLILLSYFIQQRNNSETIESLTQQHAEFSSTALEKIENLQNTNIALIEKADKYESRISDLEEEERVLRQQLTDSAASRATLQSDYDTLQLKYNAISDLMRLEAAITARDTDKAKEIEQSLEAQKDYLGEFSVKFDALKAKLK
ncbi:MAG: hypothetical protein EOM54_11495 [Clostridia bacterium]|nr:hypothetical protein [Clostridia bacterium]